MQGWNRVQLEQDDQAEQQYVRSEKRQDMFLSRRIHTLQSADVK